MAQLQQIIHWCDTELKTAEFKDYAPNGLQIEGKSEVKKLVTAVTASLDAIEKAIELNADALLVHHGYFWKGEAYPITGMRGQRIKKLIQHDISLIAYHLPLDSHPTLGNNAIIAEKLNLKNIQALDPLEKYPIGNVAELETALTPEQFKQLLIEKIQVEATDTPILHLPASTSVIKKIGYCTGAAQDYIHKAQLLGCDAFISGEVSERTFYEAKELGVHYFACGHHATERYGVQRLGEALAKAFNLDYAYIELNNPI